MKVQLNTYKPINNYPARKQAPSFQGLIPRKEHLRASKDFIYYIVKTLGVDFKQAETVLKGAGNEKALFLASMSERYNAKYFNSAVKEPVNAVFDLFNKVKNPSKLHRSIVHNVHGSFEYLGKIFESANDKNSLKFVRHLYKDVFKGKKPAENIVLDLLSSANRKEFIKHPEKYSSYLKLNINNENAVKTLDELVSNGKYDKLLFDKKYALRRHISDSMISNIISESDLLKYYSPAGKHFLDVFTTSYYPRRNFPISETNKTNILEIYKSANRKNEPLRTQILDIYRYVGENDEVMTSNEIKAMRSLFGKMDSSKDAFSFVRSLLKSRVEPNSISTINEILEFVPPKKANIFRKNIFRILSKTRDTEELKTALQNDVMNPFFEGNSLFRNAQMEAIRRGYIKPESKLTKFGKFIENKFNELKYKFFEKNDKVTSETSVEKVIELPSKQIAAKPVEEAVAETAPKEIAARTIENVAVETAPKEIVTKPVEEAAAPKIVSKVENTVIEPKQIEKVEPKRFASINIPSLDLTTTVDDPSINLVRTLKESPKARKLRVINDVKDVISKKLHSKTLEKQEDLYVKNATKMRLKLLPEIFDSIKETRAVDRAVGKKKINSSNKDAVELYNRINGKNRKLVRYMLLKRNVDGTRMFEVKDIISFLDKASEKMSKQELKAPQIKEYYEHLYQAKLDQYGKLKKARKK